MPINASEGIMLANEKSTGPRLAISHGNPASKIHSGYFRRKNAAPALAAPPAMADSVLLLQVLLSGPAVNLRSVADVIRNDVGLTVQLLKLVSLEEVEDGPIGTSITRSVIHAGINRLRILAAEAEIISGHPYGRAGVRACEQFWAHARLTGLMAEELADKAAADTEGAYVAGLLFHLGELPAILGWEFPEVANVAPHERGEVLAREWHLPELLSDVVCGDDTRCSPESRSVLDLVRVADRQASRLQGLVAKFARGVF
jgi:HD-like signal output (HDOD) protein